MILLVLWGYRDNLFVDIEVESFVWLVVLFFLLLLLYSFLYFSWVIYIYLSLLNNN